MLLLCGVLIIKLHALHLTLDRLTNQKINQTFLLFGTERVSAPANIKVFLLIFSFLYVVFWSLYHYFFSRHLNFKYLYCLLWHYKAHLLQQKLGILLCVHSLQTQTYINPCLVLMTCYFFYDSPSSLESWGEHTVRLLAAWKLEYWSVIVCILVSYKKEKYTRPLMF